MNGLMKENQLTVVKKYKYIKPLINKIDSIIDIRTRDCHNKYFHAFDHICVYDINHTTITNIGILNLTISDENMSSYEWKKN